jgi:hypothetical protein
LRFLLCTLILASLISPPAASVAASARQDAAKLIQPSPHPAPVAQPIADAPLTNDGVLALLDAQLAPEVVVAKIKSADATKFDTSPDALRQLRDAGAPEIVIEAMLPARDAGSESVRNDATHLAPVSVKIPAGVHLDLEMAHTIDSLTTRTNDLVSLRVVNPVMVEGVTVIAVGATATAKVVKAERNGHFGRAGRITWELKEVTAVDGTRVPLTSAGHVVGDSKGAKVAATMALSVLSPFALAVGFKRGENAVVPEGKRFDAFVANESTVNAPVRR